MSEQQRYLDIEARHQEVRSLIERQYPGCRVAKIEECVTSHYKLVPHTLDEYVLTRIANTYAVEAKGLGTHPDVMVWIEVDARGALQVVNTEFRLG